MSIKEDFLNEAKGVQRIGILNLIEYLEDQGFFEAPASSKYHGSHEGGLAAHSMYVHDVMKELLVMLPIEISEESIHICGLFHDVCKINFYMLDEEEASSAQLRYLQDLCDKQIIKMPVKSERTKSHVSKVINALKSGGILTIPTFKQAYNVVDKLPMGHGEKSVYIIQKHMQLTDEEALAIRWHLGGFDPAAWNSPMGNPSIQAFRENKLLALLAGADLITSYLLDAW